MPAADLLEAGGVDVECLVHGRTIFVELADAVKPDALWQTQDGKVRHA